MHRPGYISKILTKKLDILVIIYLDAIFIFIKNLGQTHVNDIWWVLKKLRKNGLFANLKKVCFYKNEIRFLEYVLLD